MKTNWLRLAAASIFLVALFIGLAAPASSGDLSHDLAATQKIKPITATRVIDSRNHLVGTLFAVETNTGVTNIGGTQNQSAVLVGFSGSFYLIKVSSTGFADGGANFLFASSDCSGQAFLPGQDASLLFSDATGGNNAASVAEGILYFAQQPYSQLDYGSFGFGNSPAEAASNCANSQAGTLTAGPVTSFNLSLLGFIPPFRLR